MKLLDGFGKACPLPLMMCKKEISAGARELAVQVDNDIAVKNILRLGKKTGLGTQVDVIEGGWLITLSENIETDGDANEQAMATKTPSTSSNCGPAGCGYAVFVGKDHVGEGDPQLGYNLVKMAIYVLSESDEVPSAVLFMNTGVKLVCGEEAQIIDSLKALEEKGTEVLVCGTCLDFYGLKNDLKVGEISNMYDILGRMQEVSKVITL